MASGSQVRSADRALALVEFFATHGGPLSVNQVREEFDIPQSSLYSLLTTVRERGWLEVDPDGRYRIGLRALLVGRSVVESDPVVQAAVEAMRTAREQIGETIHLARLEGTEIVYLASEHADHVLTLRSIPGRRLPAFTTGLGKALLAERLDDDLDAHLPGRLAARSPYTITDRKALREDLHRTRERGYARDDQEGTEGISCVAVALLDAVPSMTALSCSIPQPRFNEARRDELVHVLMAARDQITARLAIRAPSRP